MRVSLSPAPIRKKNYKCYFIVVSYTHVNNAHYILFWYLTCVSKTFGYMRCGNKGCKQCCWSSGFYAAQELHHFAFIATQT